MNHPADPQTRPVSPLLAVEGRLAPYLTPNALCCDSRVGSQATSQATLFRHIDGPDHAIDGLLYSRIAHEKPPVRPPFFV